MSDCCEAGKSCDAEYALSCGMPSIEYPDMAAICLPRLIAAFEDEVAEF